MIRVCLCLNCLYNIIDVEDTVNSELLFPKMALKDIFATLKIDDKGVIYLYQ